ncbi:aminomethyltransferase family protein [Sandaracinus amylolyticus]|uniref:Aminomethyltransferase n=1 Tax=Sandaracinus amylolyticus TaxID=927083 RepID=A0A0F6W0D5_9BACT|nr:aminomethyltransferase family protein [Sandaracinus amylolyticus]AKF04262.1 Aminomethyltransferase [Sandaracinus amylolyticus]
MILPPEIVAIRAACGLVRASSTRVVRLRGDGARDTALWTLPSRLHLRDAQARQSLLLDEHGRPIADVVVCADDEEYLLLIDGPCDAVAHLRAHARGDVDVVDVSTDHDVLEVHGPWAWELVAEVLGEDLLALPYLNFFRVDEGLCVRAGRTGEYGYHVIVAKGAADALWARLLARGADFDAAVVSQETLALCAFESWFFDAAHVPEGATPIELQLQWRLATDRDFLGRDAIERHRATSSRAQVCIVSPRPLEVGDRVTLGARELGTITRAAFSSVRDEWVAAAMIPRELAHGGIDRFEVGGVRVRTVAPPLIDNRSLYVDPRRHAYRARDEISFGPLTRPARAAMRTAEAR